MSGSIVHSMFNRSSNQCSLNSSSNQWLHGSSNQRFTQWLKQSAAQWLVLCSMVHSVGGALNGSTNQRPNDSFNVQWFTLSAAHSVVQPMRDPMVQSAPHVHHSPLHCQSCTPTKRPPRRLACHLHASCTCSSYTNAKFQLTARNSDTQSRYYTIHGFSVIYQYTTTSNEH